MYKAMEEMSFVNSKSGSQEQEIKSFIQLGDDAIRKGNYDDCILNYSEALRLAKEHSNTQLQKKINRLIFTLI